MMSLLEKTNYCDCCHGSLLIDLGFGNVLKFGYIVYTNEGDKVLCGSCLQKYNVTDKLPVCEKVKDRKG